MSRERKPKGIVLYYDVLEMLKNVPCEVAGRLIQGVYDYAVAGEEPTFEPGTLEAAVFPLIKSQVKHSLERYEETVNSRILAAKYKAYTDYEKRGGRVPKSFSEWKSENADKMELCDKVGIGHGEYKVNKPP